VESRFPSIARGRRESAGDSIPGGTGSERSPDRAVGDGGTLPRFSTANGATRPGDRPLRVRRPADREWSREGAACERAAATSRFPPSGGPSGSRRVRHRDERLAATYRGPGARESGSRRGRQPGRRRQPARRRRVAGRSRGANAPAIALGPLDSARVRRTSRRRGPAAMPAAFPSLRFPSRPPHLPQVKGTAPPPRRNRGAGIGRLLRHRPHPLHQAGEHHRGRDPDGRSLNHGGRVGSRSRSRTSWPFQTKYHDFRGTPSMRRE